MSVKQMALVWDLDLPHNKKFVLLAYADHADHDGENVYPSLERVAHKTGYSRDQVRRIASELVKDRLMERVARATHDHPARYRLTLERGSKLQPLKKRGVANDPSQVGANDPSPEGVQMPPEPSVEPSVEPSTPVGAETSSATASADTFVSFLAEELEGSDVPYTSGWRGRHGKQFKECIRKGVPEATLYKACDRIVERWTGEEHRKLTVEQALEDVVNGKPPKHADSARQAAKGTPPEVIEYVFANTRNDTIKSRAADLRRVMELFDFSTGESPPYPIEKQLGGSDNERWAVLNGLQTLCRRAKAGAVQDVA